MAETLQLSHLNLTDITASRSNPRKTFDEKELDELADSIREKGVLQPILVRESKKGGYEIIAGERRYRASKIVGSTTIPAIIREMSDEEALEVQIIENLQRKDVHPMEEAVGFMHLQQIKKFDVKEIAARVGKSANYVAQRLKLNELIEDLQKAFYTGRILVKDAVLISTMSEDNQGRLYENELDGNDHKLEMNKYAWSKYRHELNSAPFDINKIIPGAPVKLACTNCPHNSAFNALLFPGEEANPVCLNKTCFEKKCDINYDLQIKTAIEDPTIILVSDYYSNETKEKSALIKKGHTVLTINEYDKLERPDYPDREFFEGDNDTEAEDEADFQRAVAEYQDELREYEADLASGKCTKAVMVDGDNKGATVYIKITKKGTDKKSTTATAGNVPSIDESSIKNEIEGIKSREKRKKELDEQEFFNLLKPHFSPLNNAKMYGNEFNQIERTAIATTLYNKLRYTVTNKSDWKQLIKMPKGTRDYFATITDEELRRFTRFFFLSELPNTNLYSGLTDDAKLCVKVAEDYFPTVVEEIKTKQNEAIEKRIKRVNDRIAKLQQQLKELKKAAAPQKTKKGKGIKALLTDAQ
jgi:ParB family chromosome partitioning protein